MVARFLVRNSSRTARGKASRRWATGNTRDQRKLNLLNATSLIRMNCPNLRMSGAGGEQDAFLNRPWRMAGLGRTGGTRFVLTTDTALVASRAGPHLLPDVRGRSAPDRPFRLWRRRQRAGAVAGNVAAESEATIRPKARLPGVFGVGQHGGGGSRKRRRARRPQSRRVRRGGGVAARARGRTAVA